VVPVRLSENSLLMRSVLATIATMNLVLRRANDFDVFDGDRDVGRIYQMDRR
jgi:hypothetical protein